MSDKPKSKGDKNIIDAKLDTDIKPEPLTENGEALTDRVNAIYMHTYYEGAVEDALEDVDNDIMVYSEENDIDTLIEHGDKATIVDYKTADMSKWTAGDATRRGDEYGRQVSGYVQDVLNRDVDPPSYAAGYIIHTGRQSEDPHVLDAYVNAAGKHGVIVKFTQGGLANDVIQAVQEAIQSTEKGATSKTIEAPGGKSVESSAQKDEAVENSESKSQDSSKDSGKDSESETK